MGDKLKTGSPCTSCNKMLNAAAPLTKSSDLPKDGDLTFCFYCGHPMTFDALGRLRDFTAAELIEAKKHPLFDEAKKVLLQYWGPKQ